MDTVMDQWKNIKGSKKTVAILYICTGEYVVFWEKFYESYEANFLKECKKVYFVFTDYQKEYFHKPNVEVIYQKSLGWPYDTLMRFDMFSKISERLKQFDYIFFMNANMECVDVVTEEEFLPKEKELLFVRHPGFWNKERKDFTYEHNPKSMAYIKDSEGSCYICGGVNGGKAAAYVKLIQTLKQNIEKDLANNVIAVWHDESHINRYMIDHDNYRLLEPNYCYPEGWEMPFLKKILVRDKSKYINVHLIKGERFLCRVKRYIKKHVFQSDKVVKVNGK